MSITPLNIGSAPNDGNGQNLRSGGQVINANFAELDARTVAAQSKADAAIPALQKGVANGVATLGADSKIPVSQLPPLAINEVFTVATQAAMLALTAQRGDMAIRTDQAGQAYVLAADAPAVLANWIQIKQSLAVALVALGAVTPAADTIAYFNGTATATTAAFTAKARALLARTDTAGMQAELGLGTAATMAATTSNTDSTLRRAVKVGDFGIGNSLVPQVTDFSTDIKPGWYYGYGDTHASAALNAPPGSGGGAISVLAMQGINSASYKTLLAGSLGGSGSQDMFIGSRWGTALPSWRRVITDGNAILDPALNTGGLMSSTVVGIYTVTKYANGQMHIVGSPGSTSALAASASTPVDFTIPSGFVGINEIVPSAACVPASTFDFYGIVSQYMINVTTLRIVLRNGATSQTVAIKISIWGRWK